MNSINQLNKEQKEAVYSESKHLRIIAGAGSGKTRVLTSRIVHLIQDKHVKPWEICAITFTNKAANEMKERMEGMIESASYVQASTIHSLCVRIIREEHEALGLIRYFTIIDTSDQQTIMREIYRKYEYDRKELSFREVLNFISSSKISNITPEAAQLMAGHDMIETRKAFIYELYETRLRELMALDFDDLLIEVNKLLKRSPLIRSKWQSKFKVILVDEFQDVDAIQYGIIQSLAGQENQLYVVGDPDQTIYTWRGANVDFISDFQHDYPDTETIVLNQNYRSSQNILNAANKLIQYNKNRPEKDLFANKESEVPVSVIGLDDQEAEAYWVVSKILELKENGDTYLDTAVLYRSNYLSRSLEKVLMARHIPYAIYGGQRFYDHAEVKDMMSFLRMVTHNDDLALRRSIGAKPRGIGPKALDDYLAKSEELETNIYSAMLYDVQHQMANKAVASYVELIEYLKKVSEKYSIAEMINIIMDLAGIREMYEKKDEPERIESLLELMSDATYFENNYEEAGLSDYIQMVSLYGDRNEVLADDHVRLMTVHSAKGLEFENVIIVGVAEDIFPNRNSMQDSRGGLEEERRLMYVAITRAKERLFLTYNKGYNFIMGRGMMVSRFIKELDTQEAQEDITSYIQTQAQVSEFEAQGGFKKKMKFKPTDQVVHDEFGEGIVISIDDNVVRIAFNFPHGLKVISRAFQGIRLKGDLS